MTDRITLTGLAVMARHGVLGFEKEIAQPFVLDITVEADLRPAGESDDLMASLSYADLAARAVEVCSGASVDLVETLAETVAAACLEWEIVEAVDVTVHKPNAPAGVAFTPTSGIMTGPSVSIRRERRRMAVIAMGTNLGRRVATMRSARAALSRLEGFEVQHVSPLVETDPVGGVEQPDYLNAVIVGRTRLAPAHLMHELHRIEREHGRVRDVRWGARTLDLDLVALGEAGEADEVRLGGAPDSAVDDVDAGGVVPAEGLPLTVPHPRAHERAFVLVPWVQATPWASVRTPQGVRALPDVLADVDVDGVRRGPAWNTPEYLDVDDLAGDLTGVDLAGVDRPRTDATHPATEEEPS